MARKGHEASNFVFVQLIEQQPGIYDKRHPDHGRRDKIDLAWEKISHEMNESVAACKERWKHIRTVFVRHLHEKTHSGSSATKMRQYYLHDAMQFMIPHITKNRHQESNLTAPHTEEDTAFSGENEDTQMNKAPNENVPENITPSESPTVIQISCKRNQDDCRQQLFGKRRLLTALDPVDTSFVNYKKQQTQSKTPDPDAEFLHSLLPDMKSMTAKQKRTFKIGILNLMDELLEDTESD